MTQKRTSPWRPAIKPPLLAESLAGAALQLEIETEKGGIPDPSYFEDPEISSGRKERGELALTIVEMALAKVAAGSSGSLELSDRPEQFFERARKEAQPHEKESQAKAVRDFLGVAADDDIMLTEQQLVQAAIRAAHTLGQGTEYGVSQLIRDGIRRVGQEMISNAVNQLNRKEGARAAITAPGARWSLYEAALLKLQTLLGTEEWTYRKPYITLSYIAGAVVGPKSNVVQIRRWAEGTGKEIVGRPGQGEDPTAGGLIVDDKL